MVCLWLSACPRIGILAIGRIGMMIEPFIRGQTPNKTSKGTLLHHSLQHLPVMWHRLFHPGHRTMHHVKRLPNLVSSRPVIGCAQMDSSHPVLLATKLANGEIFLQLAT